MFSRKGRMVFSEEYRRVIESTPEIKYQTSCLVSFFVVLMLALVTIGVVAFLVGG